MGSENGAGARKRPLLAAHHVEMLKASAIRKEVALARGYRTARTAAELRRLGFAPVQCIAPALAVPVIGVDGTIVNYQCRPDQPRINSNTGKLVKYETVAGSSVRLDVPPVCRRWIGSPTVPLCVTEGIKKGDSLASAGACVVGLLGVDSFRVDEDWERISLDGRPVLVVYDSDVMVKPSVHGALERIAKYLGARGADLRFVYLPTVEGKMGVDDFLAGGGTLEDLQGLAEERLRDPPPEEKPKRAAALPTAMLLDLVERLVKRFVVFRSEHEPVVIAAFVLHTWALEAFNVTPYLVVTSPEKRSAKTRLLESIELCAHTPIRAASITAAAVFQAVEKWRPTLLLDELDTIFRARSEQAEALRGVLNSGNRRGDHAIRGTQDGEPAQFSIFCPKVLAGIDNGRLPDTIRDRALVIVMQRRRRDEPVSRLVPTRIEEQLVELRARLEDWAVHNIDVLRDAEPIPADGLNDRLEEAVEPLLAVTDLAGPEWGKRIRDAVVALAKGAEDVGDEAHGHLLVVALGGIFGDELAMSSEAMCKALNADDDLPFGAYGNGSGIAARGLAKLLKPYGIKSKDVWVDVDGEKKSRKGYEADQFTDAWTRYAQKARSEEAPGEAREAREARELNARGDSALADLADLADEVQPSAHAHVPAEPLCRYRP
jgi:hypothetical protein